jgi:hypothetical protein
MKTLCLTALMGLSLSARPPQDGRPKVVSATMDIDGDARSNVESL